MNYDEKDIIDIEHEDKKERTKENNPDEQIELSYYTTKQVAEIIEEPDSTVRYWSKIFDKHLKITISNKNRAFTKTDVNRLLQIKGLKEKGMTLKQIDDYFLQNGFETERGLIDPKNPLAIETFMSTLTQEMNSKMDEFQKEITEKIMATMLATQKMILVSQEDTQDRFKEQIAITIDEAVTDKLEEFKGDLKASVDELGDNVSNKVETSLKNASISSETVDNILEVNKTLAKTVENLKDEQSKSYDQQEKTNDLIAKLKLSLEENKLKSQQEEIDKQNNKGFFSRLLGK